MQITDTIESIPKLQKPQIAALKKLGLNTVRDLLLHFPYRYLDFSKTSQIKDLRPGENVSIKVKIKSIASRFSFRGRMSLAEAVVSDESGSLKVTWFNQPYLAQSFKPGDELFLSGCPDYYNSKLQLTNPLYEKVTDFPLHTARLVPLYHLKQSLYPRTFRNLIALALPATEQIADDLPEEIVKNQNLLTLKETIRYSHFPEKAELVEQAKKRLAFEEIFLNQLAAQKHKIEIAQKKTFSVKFDQNLIKTFVDSLPFSLTAAQKKSAWEILQDLEKPTAMNRLLEGDVGSGKTLVALIAALQMVSGGYQVVFLTPTEILAYQHLQTIKKYLPSPKIDLSRLGSRAETDGRQKWDCCLLTNSYSETSTGPIPKDRLKKLISQGMPGIFVGTHALLQKGVKFKKLALVIIDEQHRFGVEQRAELISSYKKVPHLLSLSATPIPRSLQLAFFGELDISQIKQKPAERKPIVTKLVEEQNRTKAYDFIRKQLLSGRQAFVITPLIEESERLEAKSAKVEVENIRKIFPEFTIGILHGKLKSSEKEAVMADFLANKINILVSTSVVEVGVDVPNASVMIIEAAERFGLSQLHQFRGRVGRAEHQSYCFLFSSQSSSPLPLRGGAKSKSEAHLSAEVLVKADEKKPDDTKKRLELFTKTSDGFELAELDLKLRGFGDVYGSSQSGWNFKYFDISYTSLIEPARQEAQKLLSKDANLETYPFLQAKIKDKKIHFE